MAHKRFRETARTVMLQNKKEQLHFDNNKQIVAFVAYVFLIAGFFFLGKSEHRVLSYIIAAFTIYTYHSNIKTFILGLHNSNKIFSVFLVFAFTTSLLHSLLSISDIGETFRLAFLPLLFTIVTIANLNSAQKWHLLLATFLGVSFIFSLYAMYDFLIQNQFKLLTPNQRHYGTGRMENPNIVGFFYGVATIMLLSYYTRINKLIKAPKLSISIFILFLTSFVFVILASQSRNAFIATTLSTGIFLLLNKNYKVFLFALAIGMAGGALLYYSNILDLSNIAIRSYSNRPLIWQMSIEQWKENMIFGQGYQTPFSFQTRINSTWNSPHNLYLGVLQQFGIIGFILFTAAWIRLFWQNWKVSQEKNFYLFPSLIIFGCLFALFEMRSIFINLHYEWFTTWLPIAFLASAKLYKFDKEL